jgi:hypothetical protein
LARIISESLSHLISSQNTHKILVTSCILLNSDLKIPLFPLVSAYLRHLTTNQAGSSSNFKLSLFSLLYVNFENNLATCKFMFHSTGCTTQHSPGTNRKLSAIKLNFWSFRGAFKIYNCPRQKVDQKHIMYQSYWPVHTFTRTTNLALFSSLCIVYADTMEWDCYWD